MRPLLTLFFLLIFSWPAWAYHPRILFDQAHGQAFVIEQESELHLSQLAQSLVSQGYEVSSTRHPLTAELLDKTDALIISGAFKPYSVREIALVKEFISQGGRVAVMIHIGPPVLPLLLELGVDVANGVIRETEQLIAGDPLNFVSSRLEAHPLTAGLKSFCLYGSWPVRPLSASGAILAYTSAGAWVDLTGDKQRTPGDVTQSFGVMVVNRIGQGELLVFGDDALFQNRFLRRGNQPLAVNLGHWLAAGRQAKGQKI
ncbi:MAG: DUF4350 domain-containing protein [Deltaproteobacteria bacterium]|nr:DUF4350 domain-containing protein [Deltaproteobacteria bacterium]